MLHLSAPAWRPAWRPFSHWLILLLRQVAHSMGVQLAPRRARVFDEVNDIVGCDLVLVMDSFDATEVRCWQPAPASDTDEGTVCSQTL